MYTKYTDEQTQWLIDNFGCSYKELTDKFNERFGTNHIWTRSGYSPIERKCKQLGLSRTVNHYGFTKEEDEWLKKYAPDYSSKWLSKNIESVSGRKHSYDAIKMHVREWLGIRKGNGGIRKDTVQTYKKEIGSLTSWGSSDVRIKLKDTGDDKVDWYPYSRYLYEQYYEVKLPPDYQVIHLDGNDTNFDINNLCAINHAEHAILSINNWHGKGQVTKTAVNYARLRMALKKQGVVFKRNGGIKYGETD